MGQLADRLAFLTRRYGSDVQAWQHEIHALAALEEGDVKQALERFHALKRRLAEFRRAQLLRELRSFAFVFDVPSEDTRGYPVKEIEADIRSATRALAHAKAIERALREEAEARASLRHRAMPSGGALGRARWDGLVALEEAAEARRRAAMREARLDARLADATRRARKLERAPALPGPTLDAAALDEALDVTGRALDAAEALEEAYHCALVPLKSPEVATYKHESRRKLEREARDLLDAGDLVGLRALEAKTEALRKEAASLASQAARSRRSGRAPPQGERRPGDGVDPYG